MTRKIITRATMFKKLDNGIDIRGWEITYNRGPIGTHREIEEYGLPLKPTQI